MNIANSLGFDNSLYARQLRVNAAKTANTAGETSFGTALKNASFSYTVSVGAQTAAQSASGSETEEIPALNTSLRWHTSIREISLMINRAAAGGEDESEAYLRIMSEEMDTAENVKRAKAPMVPVGRNELATFMEEIEKGLADGESFDNILQKQIDKHIHGVAGESTIYDFFFINPSTGEIQHAQPSGRCFYDSQEIINTDEDSVWDLAYDLQQFINATVFKPADMDSDKADKIVAEVKARQKDKIFDRFDRPFGSVGYQGWVAMNTNMKIELGAAALAAYAERGLLDGAGGGNMTDYFISAIGEHQDDEYAQNALFHARANTQLPLVSFQQTDFNSCVNIP